MRILKRKVSSRFHYIKGLGHMNMRIWGQTITYIVGSLVFTNAYFMLTSSAHLRRS